MVSWVQFENYTYWYRRCHQTSFSGYNKPKVLL